MPDQTAPRRIFSCGHHFAIVSEPSNDPYAKGRLYDPDQDLLSPPLPISTILGHIPTSSDAHWVRTAEADIPMRLRQRLEEESGQTGLDHSSS